MKAVFLGCTCILSIWGFLPPNVPGEQNIQAAPCPTVVTLLVTQFIFNVPIAELPRLEVRQCGSEEELQIVAWKNKAKMPSLVIDTYDHTVVQAVARANIFVIETTGGPRDLVYVIVYRGGEPTLALKSVTKGTANVSIGETQLNLVISGIFSGDANPRTETYSFKLSEKDLFPKNR